MSSTYFPAFIGFCSENMATQILTQCPPSTYLFRLSATLPNCIVVSYTAITTKTTTLVQHRTIYRSQIGYTFDYGVADVSSVVSLAECCCWFIAAGNKNKRIPVDCPVSPRQANLYRKSKKSLHNDAWEGVKHVSLLFDIWKLAMHFDDDDGDGAIDLSSQDSDALLSSSYATLGELVSRNSRWLKHDWRKFFKTNSS
eukprot:TRINITY_DN4773_c0_g1_i1.p2 TRINITY_DN4773_c0_g1~~TRINITY_DN4773_c0_g1_i1.p2  ORF type:complete len:198 (-),score=27.38 TRINITY_DN4773_c0_g1_i1:929-1522(-)